MSEVDQLPQTQKLRKSRRSLGCRESPSASACLSRARMHCEDFIALLSRYDEIDMLDFELADLLPPGQAAGQFPHQKSEHVDRLISNRRPRNSQEEAIGASGQLFPHGCLFCEEWQEKVCRRRPRNDPPPRRFRHGPHKQPRSAPSRSPSCAARPPTPPARCTCR